MSCKLARLVTGGVGHSLPSFKSSKQSPVVALGTSSTGQRCGESRLCGRRRQPQQLRHHRHHSSRHPSFASKNVSRNHGRHDPEAHAALFFPTGAIHRPYFAIRANESRSADSHRGVHGGPTTGASPWPSSETEANEETATTTTTTTMIRERQRRPATPKSDPTAGRPTRKCDPYGLGGESLSRARCEEWMSTLDDGWELVLRTTPEDSDVFDDDDKPSDERDGAKGSTTTAGETTITTTTTPTSLRKRYRHRSFLDASRFLSRVSLLATNVDHFPVLSMERILVDDAEGKSNLDGATTTRRERRGKRKVKGWAFRSTVRCFSYRPPTTAGSGGGSGDEGLTYHDFHLAMSIDVEASREEVKVLFW